MLQLERTAREQAKHYVMQTKMYVALYFSNKKLQAVYAEDAMYERTVVVYADNLLGIYANQCNLDHVLDDIKYFYNCRK